MKLRLNAISLLCGFQWFEVERGRLGVKGGPKTGWRRGAFMDIFMGTWFSDLFFKKWSFGQTCYTFTGIECTKHLYWVFLSLHPNSKFTNFQVLGNYMNFPPTSPTSLLCMVLNYQALLKYGHFELAHTNDHNEGWMVSDRETVCCWVPVPLLTMVVTSVAFLKNHCLSTNNLLVGS